MSQPMSSCLPHLVALIHHIFKSVNCSSVTKEELVHKIIINSFDIVERSMYQWCSSSIGFDWIYNFLVLLNFPCLLCRRSWRTDWASWKAGSRLDLQEVNKWWRHCVQVGYHISFINLSCKVLQTFVCDENCSTWILVGHRL